MTYEWNDNESLKIWCTASCLEEETQEIPLYPMAIMITHFRHEKFVQEYHLGRARDLEALIGASNEFGVNRKMLEINIRYRSRKKTEAFIHERLVASDNLEDPAECSVWIQLGLKVLYSSEDNE
jgi:hypothetical protein